MDTPLILLHGALGSVQQVKPLAKALGRWCDAYPLNFSGHGGDLSEGEFNFDIFQSDILNLLALHGIKKANFFGYSMGGYAAISLAFHHPEVVNKIFTLGTKLKWDKVAAEKEVQMLDPLKVEEKVPKFASFLSDAHHPADWRNVMRKTADMMLALGKDPAISDHQFQQIQHPILLVVGDGDHMAGVEDTLFIGSRVPNAEVKVLPNTLHPLEKVNQEMLLSEILKYFDYQ